MYMNDRLGELLAIFSYKNEFQCLESFYLEEGDKLYGIGLVNY